ncbi:MAG: hypothetical protein ACRC8K_09170 [Waterburya sp.]
MLQITAQSPFSAKSCTPPPKKPSTREREYLHTDEINAIIRAAKKVGRHGVRDGVIILLMFRHGLRTAELVALKRSHFLSLNTNLLLMFFHFRHILFAPFCQ